MAFLPFPYAKKRYDEDYRSLRPNVDPSFTPGGETDEALRRGQGALDQFPAQQSSYPVIDGSYVSPADPVVTTPVAVPEPAVDPALLTRARTVTPPPQEPMVSRSGQTMDENAARPRLVETDKSGHPIANPTIDDALERNVRLKERVDAYEPRAEPKWKRWSRIAAGIGSIVGASVAKDPRTAAVAAHAVGRNLSNSKAVDEDWKSRELGAADDRINETLKQHKVAADTANTLAQPELRRESQRQRQQGLDRQGRRVADLRIQKALDYYNKIDYTPGTNPALDKYFEDSGLHDLEPHRKDDVYQAVWDNGRLLTVAKKAGIATAVTEGKGGPAVVDESKVADQSVKLPNGTVLDHLTPREKAVMEGRVYESEADRKSREKIAAGSQQGQDRRAAMKGNGAAINPSVKGAVGALSKFRAMTANIEKQKALYATQDDPSGMSNPQGAAILQSLYDERDAYEANMMKLYGKYIELDDKGKPGTLRDDAMNAPASSTGYTEQDVRDRWNATPPKRRAQKTADEAVAAARAAHLIP